MGSKPSSQSNTSSTYSPPPAVLQNYQQVTQQAQNVAATPYQAYSGQLVAPINGQQSTGINAINSASGIQNGYNAGATGLAAASAANINPQQFSGQALQQYENPYQSQVVNATEAELQQQNQQQAAALQSQSIASGAFGGDRAGVAQAALAGQQDIANNATIAGLNTSNFQNAESEFNTQQATNLSAQQNTAARQLAASQQLGTLGNTAQTEALNEANAQTNAGTLQQTTQQAQDTANYNQFLQQQAYPFQTTGWLANIVEGIGSQSGGTTTGQSTTDTSTGSSILGGLIGLGGLFAPKADGGRVKGLAIPYEAASRIARSSGGLVGFGVPHKATGGGLIPYGMGATPYAAGLVPGALGGGSIVPTPSLAVGRTMPSGGGMGVAQAQTPQQEGQQIAGIAKGIQGLGSAFENSSLGDSFNDAMQDMGDGYARGGLVSARRGYAKGGLISGGLLGGRAFGGGALGFFADGGAVRRRYDDGGIVQYDPSQGLGNGDLTPEALAQYGTQGAATPSASPAYVQPSEIASPSWATAAADIPTPEAAMAAAYANQMPAPQQSGYSPTQQLAAAMGAPMPASGNAPAPDAPAGLVPSSSDVTSPQGLAVLRTAMGGADRAPANPNSAYGDIDAYGNAAPLPTARPAGLGLVSADAATQPSGLVPASAAPRGLAPQSPVSAGGMWTAPAYSGPAPQGPAPDPADYPTTPEGQAAFIRDYAPYAGGRGMDPNFGLSVAHAEGLNGAARGPNLASTVDIDAQTGRPFSFGAFQLNVRNGLGNLARASGIDPADPAQQNIANKFAMDYMAAHGLEPWRGDRAVLAYQGGRGLASAPAAQAIDAAAPQATGLVPTASAYDTAPSGRGGLALSPPVGLGAATANSNAPSSPSGALGANPITQGLAALFPGLHVSDSERQGIIAAGLGMMAGTSRNPWVNIGQGGLQGLAAYNQARNLESEIGLRQQQAQHLGLENKYYPRLTEADLAQTNANTGLLAAKGRQAQGEAEIVQSRVDLLHQGLQEFKREQDQKAKAVSDAADSSAGAPPVSPSVSPLAGRNAPASSAPVPRPAGGQPGAAPTSAPTPDPAYANSEDPNTLRRLALIYDRAGIGGGDGLRQTAQDIETLKKPIHLSDGTMGYYPPSVAAQTDLEARKKYAGAEAVDPLTGAKYFPAPGSVGASAAPAPGTMATGAPPSRFAIDPTTARVSTAVPAAPPGGGYIQPNLPPGARLTELPETTKKQMEMDGEFQKDQVSTMRATPTVIARTQAIAQAFKTFQSGTLTDKQHDAAALATALGFPSIAQGIMRGSISGPEWVDKEGVQSVLDTLKSATPRFAQSEFNAVASHGTPNTTNQPEANHEMVSEMLALGERNNAFMKDWETAKQQGWASPSAFYEAWDAANPLNGFIRSAQRQVGNFAGMDLPPAKDWAAGTVYVAPKTMPPNTAAALARYGVRPGTMFRYNGPGTPRPIAPVAKSEYFSAQLGQ